MWRYVIVHHTGAEEKDAAQVKRYHLGLGWVDVGYNFLIERDGKVVPGRSLEIPGAHCSASGMNRQGIGVAVIGNLEVHPPTGEAWFSLVLLCARLCREHGIPPARVLGHREVPGAATLCPGKHLPLGVLREEVKRLLTQSAALQWGRH